MKKEVSSRGYQTVTRNHQNLKLSSTFHLTYTTCLSFLIPASIASLFFFFNLFPGPEPARCEMAHCVKQAWNANFP